MKDEIEKAAKNREQEDQKDPGKFIRGLFVLVEDVKTHPNAYTVKRKICVAKSPACTGSQNNDQK
jgi:hypothetical protein